MRLFLMTAFALCAWPGLIRAQESPALVESVISANPQPDGKAYLLSVVLQDGRHLSLEVRPEDAAKIVGGMTKTVGSGPERQQVVALVSGMTITADPQGRFVLLQPSTSAGPLPSMAIPVEGAERFLQLFHEKAVETKANATKTPDQKGEP
jgi:hypothetical protein